MKDYKNCNIDTNIDKGGTALRRDKYTPNLNANCHSINEGDTNMDKGGTATRCGLSIGNLLFIINIISMVVSYGIILFILLISLKNIATIEAIKMLKDFARSLQYTVSNCPRDKLEDLLVDLGRIDGASTIENDGSLRISVINKEGFVVADSTNIDISENHASRQEVFMALHGKEGSAIRQSSVTHTSTIYYALPITIGGSLYALRVATRLDESVYFSSNIRGQLVTSFAIIMAIVVALTLLVYLYIVKGIKGSASIRTLEERAFEYAKGNWQYKKQNTGGVKELLHLEKTMDTMASRIQRLEKIKSDFVSGVSHELKTPITVIRGFSQILQEEETLKDGKVACHFASMIERAALRLNNIIDDLLTLCKLERDEAPLWTSNCDICEVSRKVIASFDAALSSANMNVVYKQSNDKIMCPLQEGLFMQALSNIIDNCIKYAGTGETIYYTLEIDEDSPLRLVKITIQDTGIGIPIEHQDRIFERFYRVDKGRSRDKGGTGLGLSIAYHIIKAHSGNIIACQRENGEHGACFIITIPIS